MKNITVKIINKSNNPLPKYQTPGASGLDLRAFLEQDVELAPLERAMIPTGLYMELPEGHEAQVRPRSGLAWKQGLTCLNSPGTVDADYRGELKVILINLSNEKQIIKTGDRIAQIVIQQVAQVILTEVKEITETDRGAGGFGHTGVI